ncbi:MAG: sulfurtransferase TusA family protein [Alphaproteobacteria bacterium]
MTVETLDVRGLKCPLPILKTKKAIGRLNGGDALEVLATDPGSVEDFAEFCRATGHELLESGENDGIYRFVLKKIA